MTTKNDTIIQPNLEYNLDKWSQIDRYTQWMFHLYESFIGKKVLEIGAGLGRGVNYYIDRCEKVVATDVFDNEISVMTKRFANYQNFTWLRLHKWRLFATVISTFLASCRTFSKASLVAMMVEATRRR